MRSSAIFVGTIKEEGGAHLDTKMDSRRGKCLLPIQFVSNSHLGRKKVCHGLDTLHEPVEGTLFHQDICRGHNCTLHHVWVASLLLRLYNVHQELDGFDVVLVP